MRLRFYRGYRFTLRGIKPYAGVSLSSWVLGKRTANKQFKIVYHCSICNAINDKDAHFCKKCGAKFS